MLLNNIIFVILAVEIRLFLKAHILLKLEHDYIHRSDIKIYDSKRYRSKTIGSS